MEAAAAPSTAPAASPAPSAPSAAPSAPTATPPASPGASTATPAPTPGSASPTTPPPAKVYRYKSGDIEAQIEADKVDALAKAMGLEPEEILKGAQMSRNAYQRWQEAAKLRKEAEEREKAWKSRYEDPRVAQIKQQNPGMDDDDAWALARVLALKEREEMSPEMRALTEERSRREALEKQVKEREETAKKAETEAATKAEAQRIDRELTESFGKHSMPKVPAVARAVLDHMAAMARAGEVPDVEAATLFVKRKVQADDVSRFSAMNDEQLEGWLGKPIIDRILRRSVEKARGAPIAAPTPPPPPKPAAEPEGRKFLNVEEWRAKYGGY